MIEQLHEMINQALSEGVGARVFPLKLGQKRIWVKQAVAPKQKGWHRLQRFFATCTGLPMLRPTVSHGGEDGLKTEISILRRLDAAAIAVPKVLASSEKWFAIDDNGIILQNEIEIAIRNHQEEKALYLLECAAKALADLHYKGFAHGAPLLRNMTLREDGQIGFIDFEEDPNGNMPLSDAQARDILLFIFSIQRGFKKRPDLVRAGWLAYRNRVADNAPQLAPLRSVLRWLWPIYLILLPMRKWLGTDAINGVLAYRTLHQTLKSRH